MKLNITDKQWLLICVSLVLAIIFNKKKSDLGFHMVGMVA